jgi:L-arabinose isomerase
MASTITGSLSAPQDRPGAAPPGLEHLECWFLTGSQTLYGDEALAQVAEHSRNIAETLDSAAETPIRVVAKPVLIDAESIRRVCLEADASDRCVGVIAWMHTFSPAKAWISGLRSLRTPLLHLHTQVNVELPWSEIDMDFMNLNQAAHGDREFGYILSRLGINRKTVSGHATDPSVTARIGDWMRAAAGWREAQSLRVARFGDNMRDVAVTEGDKVEAQATFGMSVNTYGVNDLVAEVERVADSDVDRVVAEYQDAYDVVPELRAGGDRHESLRYAARIEIGLRAFLDAGGFKAFTTNFQDLGALRQLPGLPVQRLMADGYGFGGEGDWKTAALLRILKVMAAGRDGGTSFMEDYTYDLTVDDPKILGSHMLEVCPSIAADRPRVEIHPLGIGGREDPVRLVFTATTGEAFVVGMLDVGERFRLVANEVDVIEPSEPLPRLPVARAVWRPRPDFATSTESWLHAGGPHHTVLSFALDIGVLEDFASIAHTELLLIDEGTTLRDFLKEIRWNQAHYRVARGF